MPAFQGSYTNCFAPRDFAPRYPQLWQGCVGAWAPCLGPTGVTLFDWSGYGRSGTLTNYDLSLAYAVQAGLYALKSDGSNDYVSLPNLGISGSAPRSTSLWVRLGASTSIESLVGWGGTSAGLSCVIHTNATATGQIYWAFNSNDISTSGGLIASDRFYHVAVTYAGGTLNSTSAAIYVDGISRTFSGGGSVPNTTDANYRLASDHYSGGTRFFDGYLDDIRIYNRALTPNEIALLATRRGIAYDYQRSILGGAAISRLLRLRRQAA